jgi:hypothetical protein
LFLLGENFGFAESGHGIGIVGRSNRRRGLGSFIGGHWPNDHGEQGQP